MKKHHVIGIAAVAFLLTIGYLCHITLKNDKAKKQEEKDRYEKTLQKDYNLVYDSTHDSICSISTRYLNLDSIVLRTQYVEGCRWLVRINGTGSDKYFHTVSNCNKCTKFLLSLKCGNK